MGVKARAIPDRVLRWDGCVNVRDLGGLPLADGGETAYRVVVRSDSIRKLTDAGWRALATYGVRTAVDLRSHGEVALDPPGDVPIEIVHFPVHGDAVPAVHEWATMQAAYEGFLGAFAPQFAGAVTTIARSDAPVVVHCHGGRDRTGLTSALILRLAGVALGAIAEEHALSDVYLEPWWQAWYDEAPDEPERERRVRVTQMPAGAMADVLADVNPREYLLAGGADEAALDRLVARLRGEA